MTQKRSKPANRQVELLWYGERGIINTIALALQKSGVPGVKAILESVEWGKGIPKWIKRLQAVQIIIEVGCGQFGDPDLIIVCHGPGGERNVVFIEAKTTTYAASAASIENKKISSFNSTINGQLSMRYRLTHALITQKSNTLSESKEIFKAYSRPMDKRIRKDSIIAERHLAKPRAVDLLSLMQASGLGESNFFYVALTNDTKSYFKIIDKEPEYRPLFFNSNGVEQLSAVFPRLGWINYHTISDIAELKRNLGSSYTQACSTMNIQRQCTTKSTAEKQRSAKGITCIKSINLEAVNVSFAKFLNEIVNRTRKEVYNVRLRKNDGSWSIISSGEQVVAKLLVSKCDDSHQKMFVGTSTMLGYRNWRAVKDKAIFESWNVKEEGIARLGGGNWRQFFVWRIESTDESAIAAVVTMFVEIDEMLSS